eukprot:gene11441-gene4549
MVNYSLAKIYKIVCNTTGLIYVGATCKPRLCQRLNQHVQDIKRYKKGKYRYMTSFKVLEINNYSIILLEEIKYCENKDQLNYYERKWIEQIDCVNKVIPSRTQKEYKECNKYKIEQYQKQYYQDNLSIKYKCDCGSILSIGKKVRHEKTIKHQ